MPRLKLLWKAFKRRSIGIIVLSVAYIIARVPQKYADFLARFLGKAVYRLSKKTRERILNNLILVYGDSMDEHVRHEMALKICLNLAFHIVESVRLAVIGPEMVRMMIDDNQCEEILNAHLEAGKSIMIVTAHYGNWELFAARIAQIAPLTVLARRNNNPYIEAAIARAREKHRVRVLDRSDPGTPREMIQMGHEGGHIVGILVDQDTIKIQGIFSNFMGLPALTPSGPAAVAIRQLFTVFIGVLKPIADHKHKIILNGPIPIPTNGSREQKIQLLTDIFNQHLSDIILEDPLYWVWNHRRWRHRPEASGN
ncbi:MAG: hypothetical protein WBM02_08975 [bacterium]